MVVVPLYIVNFIRQLGHFGETNRLTKAFSIRELAGTYRSGLSKSDDSGGCQPASSALCLQIYLKAITFSFHIVRNRSEHKRGDNTASESCPNLCRYSTYIIRRQDVFSSFDRGAYRVRRFQSSLITPEEIMPVELGHI